MRPMNRIRFEEIVDDALAELPEDVVARVDNLHVVATAKRRGIGAALMRDAGGWLHRRHPELGVYLWVLASNATARRFYQRLGGRSAEKRRMETHGQALVTSCRFAWPKAAVLAGL